MLLMLALVAVINLPTALLGLRFDDQPPGVAASPPGWLVVLVWNILFPAMGVARWLVVTSGAATGPRVGWAIVALAVLCAAYAYYTLGLERLTGVSAAVFGLAGNAVVIAAAAWVAALAAPVSPLAAALVAAVAVWTAFASVSVAQLVARL
jgi:tryptophan-rich sensory protein